jgi:hypothetical protein
VVFDAHRTRLGIPLIAAALLALGYRYPKGTATGLGVFQAIAVVSGAIRTTIDPHLKFLPIPLIAIAIVWCCWRARETLSGQQRLSPGS